jgi:hypothetical protein
MAQSADERAEKAARAIAEDDESEEEEDDDEDDEDDEEDSEDSGTVEEMSGDDSEDDEYAAGLHERIEELDAAGKTIGVITPVAHGHFHLNDDDEEEEEDEDEDDKEEYVSGDDEYASAPTGSSLLTAGLSSPAGLSSSRDASAEEDSSEESSEERTSSGDEDEEDDADSERRAARGPLAVARGSAAGGDDEAGVFPKSAYGAYANEADEDFSRFLAARAEQQKKSEPSRITRAFYRVSNTLGVGKTWALKAGAWFFTATSLAALFVIPYGIGVVEERYRRPPTPDLFNPDFKYLTPMTDDRALQNVLDEAHFFAHQPLVIPAFFSPGGQQVFSARHRNLPRDMQI